jgi:hypothetical protein
VVMYPQGTPTPTPTTRWVATGGCQDCYQNCVSRTTNSVSEKIPEIIVNTCRSNCDRQYNTNVASCFCANAPACGEDEYRVISSDFQCSCQQTGTGTTTGMPDLSSVWTAHYEGQQPSTGQSGSTCKPECKGWCIDSDKYPPHTWCCKGYTTCP